MSLPSNAKPRRPRFWLWLACVPFALGAALVLLVGIAYLVENWRGQRALKRCRQALLAKGEKLAWADFLAKPVPAESNFFRAPGMGGFVREKGQPARGLGLPGLPKGYSQDTPFSMADLRQLPRGPADAGRPSLESLLNWFRTNDAFVRQMQQAAQRPLAQREHDPDTPFGGRSINFVSLRTAAQWLTSKARAELVSGEPDQAEQSLALVARLAALGGEDQPATLVQSMISVSIADLGVSTFEEGWMAGLWKEPQWARCQEQLQRLDVLGPLAQALRVERAGAGHMLEDWPRNKLVETFTSSSREKPFDPTILFIRLCPRGWLLQNQVVLFELDQKFLDSFSPLAGQVDPRRVEGAGQDLQSDPLGRSPYSLLAAMAVPNFSRAIQTAARAQARLRQAGLVCTLERYRSDTGAYPESLQNLVPRYLAKIPEDVIAGAAFKYQRQATNVFLLYSLGWNGRDDGGIDPGSRGRRAQPDSGDWVWGLGSR